MQVRALTAAGLIVAAAATAACSAQTSSTPASINPVAPTTSAGTAAATAAAATAAAASAAGGGGTLDVCALMTSAQASSINAVTYGASTPAHPENGFDTCTYKNTGKHVSPVDIQDLTVYVISLSGCYSQLEQTDGPGTKVSGVGDAAFGFGIGIIVEAGDRCVEVSGLTDAELDDNYGPDTAMAKIIIAKLG
jgi:hypothetical protein